LILHDLGEGQKMIIGQDHLQFLGLQIQEMKASTSSTNNNSTTAAQQQLQRQASKQHNKHLSTQSSFFSTNIITLSN
jgi:FtsZ-binding cell division protein ZapB